MEVDELEAELAEEAEDTEDMLVEDELTFAEADDTAEEADDFEAEVAEEADDLEAAEEDVIEADDEAEAEGNWQLNDRMGSCRSPAAPSSATHLGISHGSLCISETNLRSTWARARAVSAVVESHTRVSTTACRATVLGGRAVVVDGACSSVGGGTAGSGSG